MKLLLILLLGVHAFWASAATTTNSPLSEVDSRKCLTFQLAHRADELSRYRTHINELEVKVTELEAKLATLDETKTEYEEKVELKNDLFDDLNLKLDALQNKVRGILQVNSRNKTETVVQHAEV